MPSLLTVQYADDFGDLVFLKEANCGDACGARIEAGASVMQSDAPQGEDGDVNPASFTQGFETGGQRAGCVVFFEDRAKDSEAGTIGCGAGGV